MLINSAKNIILQYLLHIISTNYTTMKKYSFFPLPLSSILLLYIGYMAVVLLHIILLP